MEQPTPQDGRERTIRALADAFMAEDRVLQEGHASEKLDTWIEPTRAAEVAAHLEACQISTPPFLNGVLVDFGTLNVIHRLLDKIEYDLEWGAKFHHDVNTQHKAAQAHVGQFLSSMLGGSKKGE